MVYITNFKCGPDSYIKHFAREAAGAPLLILQFDGHGNDAGYMTRCEAYLDSKGILRCYQPPKEPLPTAQGGGHPLTGKRIYIPPMAWGSARAFASAFRAVGLEAEPTPPSDHRTRELGARYTSGDECYPAKVTVGDFMKVLERPGIDPSRVAFFMPTAEGPCRFGQYAPYLRQILDANGLRGRGDSLAHQPQRLRWPGHAGQALRAHRLARPVLRRHATETAADPASLRRAARRYRSGLRGVAGRPVRHPRTVAPGARRPASVVARLAGARARPLPPAGAAPDRSLPLIGIVGEIFCRLNTFSNEDLVRCLEAYGAEAWVSDLVEWIWYTNSEHFRKLKLAGRIWTAEALGAWVRKRVQKRDEHVLLAPFADDFAGREEPDIYEILEAARPYLPREGAFGEMVLNVGKAVCLAARRPPGSSTSARSPA